MAYAWLNNSFNQLDFGLAYTVIADHKNNEHRIYPDLMVKGHYDSTTYQNLSLGRVRFSLYDIYGNLLEKTPLCVVSNSSGTGTTMVFLESGSFTPLKYFGNGIPRAYKITCTFFITEKPIINGSEISPDYHKQYTITGYVDDDIVESDKIDTRPDIDLNLPYGYLTYGEPHTFLLNFKHPETQCKLIITSPALGKTDKTYIINASDSNEFVWTPPLEWLGGDITEKFPSIKIELYSYYLNYYNNWQGFGTTKTYSIAAYVPEAVYPSITTTVTDGEGYFDKFGRYVQGNSTFKVKVDVTVPKYCAVKELTITANSATYDLSSELDPNKQDYSFSKEIETDKIIGSGTGSITALIKDSRSWTYKSWKSPQIYEYIPPIISALKVKRCNADGTENSQGGYIQVSFNGDVTALGSLNSARYFVRTKKTADDSFDEYEFVELSGNHTVSAQTYIFEADTGSAYDIVIVIQDDFNETARNTTGSTAFVIMHFGADGESMGVGKIAELPGGFDVGFKFRLFEGLVLRTLGENADLDTFKTSNLYLCTSDEIGTLSNCPDDVECEFYLEVASTADESKGIQRMTTLEEIPRTKIRYFGENGFSNWV